MGERRRDDRQRRGGWRCEGFGLNAPVRFSVHGGFKVVPGLLLSLTLSAGALYMPGAVEKERFKAYFTQGEQLYAQGEYGAAIWNFRRADRQLATPEVIYDLAKCYEKLGDVAFSTYYYRLYLKRAPTATDALDVAERVGTALSHAEGEGRGFLEVEVSGGDKLVVAGQHYPEGPVALFLPPGDYEISGSFPGGVRRMVAQLRTGKTTNLVFEPVSPPLISSTPGAPDEAIDLAVRGPPNPRRGLRVASWVSTALGVAALGVGTALGAMAAGEAGRLKTDKSMTVSQATALAGSANGKGLGADLLWSVGGVAVAGGALMFVFSMPEPGIKQGSGGGQ
jgi:hypothetical protein